MTVELLSHIDYPKYTAFVNQQNKSTVYHTLQWRSVIEKTYGYQAVYIIKKQQNRISAILPLFLVKTIIKGSRLVCLPFSHFVPPLYQRKDDLNALLSFASQYLNQNKVDYLEIKANLDFLQLKNQKQYCQFYNSTLDLSIGIEQLWKNFDPKKVRWGINKAKKSGLIVKKCQSLSDYLQFYQLELETRKRQGSPPYSKDFFINIFHLLKKESQVELYLALLDNRAIAGIIMLYQGRNAIFGYGASVSDRQILNHQPNHLLLWHAIQDAHQRGIACFDFGTTALSNTGLLRFKKGWGTQTEKLSYSVFSNLNHFPVFKRESISISAVSKILKRLPLPVLGMIGPHLLKQLG